VDSKMATPPNMMINYELEGVVEHKVQSNIEFKLITTRGGVPCETTQEVTAWLKGIKDEVRGNIHKGQGFVRINFHVGTAGAYELHILVNKKLLYQPSIVNVLDQKLQHTEDLRFEITGEVLNGGRVGHEYPIKIAVRKEAQLYDINVNDLQVRVGKPTDLQILKPQKTGKGSYQVVFSVPVPGFHPIDVWYEGKSVIRQPEKPHFISDSDPKQTRAIQIPTKNETVGQVTSFVIQSRNASGVNNIQGGDNFDVSCEGPAGLKDLVVRDTLDGKYIVSFTPTASGIYKLTIAMNGVPIGNSPVQITAIRK